jgi:aryl-alcohol dehydrogenase-like predicted oxidoreductase
VFYGKVDSDEERFKVLDRAYELGERFWDTSDFYGDNEELIGKWFKRTGKRKDIFLATKFAATVSKYLLPYLWCKRVVLTQEMVLRRIQGGKV